MPFRSCFSFHRKSTENVRGLMAILVLAPQVLMEFLFNKMANISQNFKEFKFFKTIKARMSEIKITKFFSKKTFVNFFSFGLFFVSKNPVNSSWNYFFITIIWISWSDKSGILLTILITAILEPLNQFLKRGRGQSDAHVIR